MIFCILLLVTAQTAHAASYGSATGTFDTNAYTTSGWGVLNIHTDDSASDAAQAYDAGRLEAILTQSMTFEMSINSLGGRSTFSPALQNWVTNNFAYLSAQAAAHANADVYWHHVNLTVSQWLGFRDGYKATAPANEQLDDMAIYALTLIGDLSDLCPAFGCISTFPRGAHMCTTKAECESVPQPQEPSYARPPGDGHCSLLVKPMGSGFTDVYFSHTTWAPFSQMTRIMKHYNFAFSSGAQHVAFSSFLGLLFSLDDWYSTSAGLTISETTIINANASLWSRLTPNSVPDWIRNMVRTRRSSLIAAAFAAASITRLSPGLLLFTQTEPRLALATHTRNNRCHCSRFVLL